MLQSEALFHHGLEILIQVISRCPMSYPFGAVQEVMELSFQDRLKVFLHLSAGHLYDDT